MPSSLYIFGVMIIEDRCVITGEENQETNVSLS
eukprot:CAMPEP_0194430860 /NCGR_PEP_ID=MMETSP0176-20130528/58960_1 /TAXON_ID=216777 /ORGANISM="Proboscia alata, Strain PI-D3" /LENGTH=32 /DNA_ID= /DNA_START= /DNA_END= /DNA_ORIENTATION=